MARRRKTTRKRTYRRRRSLGKSFDTKVITDSLIASLIVQKAPDLLSSFIPMDMIGGMTTTALGAGSAYLAGKLLKKPMVSNVGIGLAIADIAGDFIEGLNPFNVSPTAPSIAPSSNTGKVTTKTIPAVADYFRLSEYTNNPNNQMSSLQYANSYKY